MILYTKRVLLPDLQNPAKDQIWALPLDGDKKPFAVTAGTFNVERAQFSPDARWVAYESEQSGRLEIYVQRFPTGPQEQISIDGGTQVRWRRDGKELFYVGLDGRLMAVSIRLDAERQTIEPQRPMPLFITHMGDPVQSTGRQLYIVSPDGQRFLMNTVLGEDESSPITVVLNWKPKS
jgi:Tol biopolymer transport system component